jgi:hypothetical protein
LNTELQRGHLPVKLIYLVKLAACGKCGTYQMLCQNLFLPEKYRTYRLIIRTRYEQHVKDNRQTIDKIPAVSKHTVNTCHTYSDVNDTMDILHITPLHKKRHPYEYNRKILHFKNYNDGTHTNGMHRTTPNEIFGTQIRNTSLQTP